jgi:hypothetical protein
VQATRRTTNRLLIDSKTCEQVDFRFKREKNASLAYETGKTVLRRANIRWRPGVHDEAVGRWAADLEDVNRKRLLV